MVDINDLGTFSSIKEVWAKYPEGGKEGDFLTINNVKYRWNKYDLQWQNAAIVTETPARKRENIDGDLSVQNDIYIGGKIHGGNITDGESAYQLAVKNGYIGTEQEWLASLKEISDYENLMVESRPENPQTKIIYGIPAADGQSWTEEIWDGSKWVVLATHEGKYVETDETLTKEGAAADAKVVGDAIGKKLNPTETGKALYIENGVIASTSTSAAEWQYVKQKVDEGDVVQISGHGGQRPLLWAIGNENNEVLDSSDVQAEVTDFVKIMPTGAKWIVINNNNSLYPNPKWYFAKAGSVGADALLAKQAQYTKYDNSQSGLASDNVQSALGELKSNIYDSTVFSMTEMFDIDKNNVGTSNSSYITIAKTDTGLTINCVKIGSASVYCSILGLSVGRTYKVSFNYQYSGIGNVTYPGNFCIRNKPNTNGTVLKGWVLGKMAPSGTINDTFTPNTTSLYFVLANADLNKVGATVDISNISILEELSLKDKISSIAEETERFSEAVESLQFEDIDTSSLPVSKHPSSATNISIDNTAPNEYTITNTSKTGGTYALIRMPVLTVGKKYKLKFKYTCNSSGQNVFGLATSSHSWSSSNLSKTSLPGSATDLQYEAVFTYATSQYYLMFYSNNMISGAVLVLKDFKITPADSYEDVIGRIENLEGNGFIPTAYSGAYAGTQIDLGNKTYYYKTTNVFSSVAGGQGMAMFGNYIFRTQGGGTCYLYETDGITATQLWSSSVADGGHSNSAQFSPLVESGNDFPYLYISLCSNPRQGCKVCKVTTEGIEVVQTIMLDNGAFNEGKNVNAQVGDDGYLYVFGAGFKVWKVRLPSVSEGDVTLTANDIIESFSVNLPYSTYPWQGGTIYNGKLFVPTGFGGNNVSRFIIVIDLSSHVVTKIDITNVVTKEPEDCDIINSSLYMAVDGSGMYKFDFL